MDTKAKINMEDDHPCLCYIHYNQNKLIYSWWAARWLPIPREQENKKAIIHLYRTSIIYVNQCYNNEIIIINISIFFVAALGGGGSPLYAGKCKLFLKVEQILWIMYMKKKNNICKHEKLHFCSHFR